MFYWTLSLYTNEHYIVTYLRGGMMLDNKDEERQTKYDSKRTPISTDLKAQKINMHTWPVFLTLLYKKSSS